MAGSLPSLTGTAARRLHIPQAVAVPTRRTVAIYGPAMRGIALASCSRRGHPHQRLRSQTEQPHVSSVAAPGAGALRQRAGGTPVGFHGAVSEFKRRLIEATLTQADGSRTRAARALGLQRTYLLRYCPSEGFVAVRFEGVAVAG